VHDYFSYVQGGIPSVITGGLGAPLANKRAFHHFVQVDITPDGIKTSVVRFDGPASYGDD
jgi:hypothetical protein